MCLHYAIRHDLTNNAIVDLIELVNQINGAEIFPPSMFLLRKLFSLNLAYRFHFYCKNCLTYIGEVSLNDNTQRICDVCSEIFTTKSLNDGNFFLTIPVAPQLKQLLDSRNQEEKLPKFQESKDGVLSDLNDGSGFKKFVENGIYRDGDLSVTFSTDGSAVYKSCKNTLWPIQFHLNELPLNERFDGCNTMLAGLWFGRKEPIMSTYFTPFIKEAIVLFEEGVSIAGITRRVIFTSCVADSVAKAALQNIKQFNGKYGCPYCYHPGDIVESNQLKYTFGTFYERRNSNQMKKDMIAAEQSGEIVKGVKGLTPFASLPYFDLVYGFPIDYMHCCLLGVAKLMANIWTSSTNHGNDYYLSNDKLKKVDDNIVAITPSQIISRRPRLFSDFVHWKANEWRAWMLFFCVPCLDNILPAKYVQNLSVFSSALFILLQAEVKKSDVELANQMLHQFVKDFQKLYGVLHMNFNVHLLLHLAKCVNVWGPLWLYSAFPFETGNGYLVKLIKGTKGVAKEIAQKYCLFSSIPLCIRNYNVSDEAIEYCDKIFTFRRNKRAVKVGNITSLSQWRAFQPNEEVTNALFKVNIHPSNILHSKKIIKDSMMFEIKPEKLKKCNDSIVKLNDNSYCEVRNFLLINNDVFAVVCELKTEGSFFDGNLKHMLPQIKICQPYFYGEIKVIHSSKLKCKSLLITVGTESYIADFPNFFEKD
nr:uncharacterized protein LOC122272752 [Parasteatoda tepidariorum]